MGRTVFLWLYGSGEWKYSRQVCCSWSMHVLQPAPFDPSSLFCPHYPARVCWYTRKMPCWSLNCHPLCLFSVLPPGEVTPALFTSDPTSCPCSCRHDLIKILCNKCFCLLITGFTGFYLPLPVWIIIIGNQLQTSSSPRHLNPLLPFKDASLESTIWH